MLFFQFIDGLVTDLGVNEAVLRARDEDVTFNFHEVCQLGRVQLPNADGVCLLLRPCKKLTDVLDHG